MQNAMLDLQASINSMPQELNDLQQKKITIWLADKSCIHIHPLRVVEDVLIKAKDFIFSVGFYILDMGESSSSSWATIRLEITFMKNAMTKIDIDDNRLSVEFDGEVVEFKHIFDIKNKMGED